MTVAISQPRYMPAIIYLQRVMMVDTFVLLDDVQHTREYENRNFIKTANGKKWLTIPCKKQRHRQMINELEISSDKWISEHKNLIIQYYNKAPYFSNKLLDDMYDLTPSSDFTAVIMQYLKNVLNLLKIETHIVRSSMMNLEAQKSEKLKAILVALNAKTYISGINGKEYLGDTLKEFGLIYHRYDPQPYPQLYGEFIPWMGFVDYLFNMGIEQTVEHLRSTAILEVEKSGE